MRQQSQGTVGDVEAIRQAVDWASRCQEMQLSEEMRAIVGSVVRDLMLLTLTRES